MFERLPTAIGLKKIMDAGWSSVEIVAYSKAGNLAALDDLVKDETPHNP